VRPRGQPASARGPRRGGRAGPARTWRVHPAPARYARPARACRTRPFDAGARRTPGGLAMTRRSRPGRPPSHVRAPTRKPTSQPSRAPGLRLLAAALAAAILGGCASFSADGGFAPVEQAARDRLGMDLHWARSDADREAISGRVAQLLASPLSMDD